MDERIAYLPFEHCDLTLRRWVKARYRARLTVIAERYDAFRITGKPEVRGGDGTGLTAGHVARGPRD